MASKRVNRAFVLEHLGCDGLKERARDVPKTRSDRVLVRMRAASLNFRNLEIPKGVYGRQPKLPLVPPPVSSRASTLARS